MEYHFLVCNMSPCALICRSQSPSSIFVSDACFLMCVSERRSLLVTVVWFIVFCNHVNFNLYIRR